MAITKLNKAEKRKITIFFSSLGLAILLWIIYSLSNRYVHKAVLYINWTDVPVELKIKKGHMDTLDARIEGSGWHLLFNRFEADEHRVSVSLKHLNGKNQIVFKPLLKKLSEQLPAGQRFVSIQPDTIHIDRPAMVSKQVPVRLKFQISYEKSYGLSGNIRLEPAFVQLRCSAEALSKISFVETEVLKKEAANDHIERIQVIKKNKNAEYRIYPEQIKVTVPVAKFTEKVLELELKVKNKQGKQALSLYPGRVKLSILTAESNYPEIGAEDFEAYVDLQPWYDQKMKRLPVRIGKKPNFIRIIKTEPQTVDFIIYP